MRTGALAFKLPGGGGFAGGDFVHVGAIRGKDYRASLESSSDEASFGWEGAVLEHLRRWAFVYEVLEGSWLGGTDDWC